MYSLANLPGKPFPTEDDATRDGSGLADHDEGYFPVRTQEEVHKVGIGVSVFLIAVGAILSFAVNASAPGANLDVIGIILMISGGLGLLVSLAFAGSGRRTVVDEHVVEHDHTHQARG
jgi:hypothetical protein